MTHLWEKDERRCIESFPCAFLDNMLGKNKKLYEKLKFGQSLKSTFLSNLFL